MDIYYIEFSFLQLKSINLTANEEITTDIKKEKNNNLSSGICIS